MKSACNLIVNVAFLGNIPVCVNLTGLAVALARSPGSVALSFTSNK